ncbi:MAG: helix-turn-helix domain-containing protein [Ignavibacteriaceae bacterium]|nr:helix-turn-helix domain-containing protein [Ignavibacteriaceae bacterium]
MYRGLKIFVAVLLLTSGVFSQSIYFNHLTTENGLSNNNVFDIIQDKSGFLWFASDDGLNRFDGYDFKVFRHEPENPNSISDNSVWVLTEDKKGNIWIGTKNGWLNRFDPATEKFTKWKIKTDEVKENAITFIYEDSKEKIWIGTYRQGLYRLDQNSGALDRWYNKPDDNTSISSNYISSIIEDSHGNFWISTYFGLNKFNPESYPHKFKHFIKSLGDHNSLSGNIIWKLTQSPSDKNIIWVGTNNGLTKLQINSETFSQIKIPNPENLQFGNSVAAVIEEISYESKILWIESYGGLIRIDLNGNNYMRFTIDKNNPQSLSSNEVHRIFRDNSGVLWIATDKGLNYFSIKSTKFNNPFSTKFRLNDSSELSKKNIKAITIDNENNIYFGTEEGLYYSTQKNGKVTINKFRQTEKSNVWSLTSDHSGNLWIGTYGSGLFKLNVKSGSLQNVQMFTEWINTQSIKFNKVVYCDKDNKIWIGYWGFGLARLDPSTGKYKGWLNDPEDSLSLSYDDVWSIHQDKKGRIWIGTDGGGLNLFIDEDGGKFLRWMADEKGSLSSNSIYSIFESGHLKNIKEDEIVLWLGTNNGLNKFVIKNSSQEKNSLTKPDVEIIHYGIEQGLADNSIKSLIEDENGNLWIGTSSGISFFDIQQNKFTNFSKADGVIGSDINLSSSARNKDGMIFMGSTEGLNYFYPSDIYRSEFIPTVLITDFQIFNESVKIGEDFPLKQSIIFTKEIILSYTQNVFSFQFAALDYTSPKSIQYSYMMEGFDNDWTYSGSRRYATYTNLNPGKYVFKIKSTNSDGVWTDNITQLNVIVTPPWWQAPWAIGLYALIFVLGVWGIIKFQEYRTRLQHELKMQEFEAHHLREIEKMKSRFFANLSHEFRTPLSLIKGPLEQLISGRIRDNLVDYYKMLLRNTEKLQNLIDQLLELSQLEAETIPLNKQQVELVSLVKGFTYSFMPLAEQKFISLNFNSSAEKISANLDRDKLEKIINNLLSNAFKFTPSGGKVSVDLSTESSAENQTAIVKIIDTGPGIPEEYQSKIFERFFRIDNTSKSGETGSGIGLALVKELVSLHNWDISVNSREGDGTVFILKIPLEKIEEAQDEKLISPLKESPDKKLEVVPLSGDDEFISGIEEKSEAESKPLILFVEDSPDVRSYVYDLLQPDYKVLLAERAEVGIEIALQNMPDLILSDLMMPGMDGIEFCSKIKSDWQTSHIPFILLTAKATEESKIEGLETGADDYLTKPFNYEELAIRIKNLIEQRKRLREKFSKEINVQPELVTSSKVDSEFLEKAITITKRNISNEKFDTEKLAEEMFVSRRQLHRKLQAITGQGPGEFIRTLRLNRAAKMLIEKNLSVTQIAYEVGFESPAQFTRAFKKHFNVLPSDFNQNIHHKTGISDS